MFRLNRRLVGALATTYLGVRASSSAVMRAQELLKRAQAVCFDVDSTVIMEEGIDVLAAHKGVGEAVAELTRKAMGGSVRFEDALNDRLSIIKVSTKYTKISVEVFRDGILSNLYFLLFNSFHITAIKARFYRMYAETSLPSDSWCR